MGDADPDAVERLVKEAVKWGRKRA